MGTSTQLIRRTISHYRILEKLGGGMGVGRKAEDTELGRFVGTQVPAPGSGDRVVLDCP